MRKRLNNQNEGEIIQIWSINQQIIKIVRFTVSAKSKTQKSTVTLISYSVISLQFLKKGYFKLNTGNIVYHHL